MPGLGGISTRLLPFSKKAVSSSSMISAIPRPTEITSAWERYNTRFTSMGADLSAAIRLGSVGVGSINASLQILPGGVGGHGAVCSQDESLGHSRQHRLRLPADFRRGA